MGFYWRAVPADKLVADGADRQSSEICVVEPWRWTQIIIKRAVPADKLVAEGADRQSSEICLVEPWRWAQIMMMGTVSAGAGSGERLYSLPTLGIGTGAVEYGEQPIAPEVFGRNEEQEFSEYGRLAHYIGINVFFEQILYKVPSFQWTNHKICCIIISFLCLSLIHI